MVEDNKIRLKQSISEKLRSLEEDSKRLNKQIKYLTENTAATLAEKIQIARELEQRNQELETLAGIVQAIIQLQPPEKVMELTANKMPRLLGADDIGIFTWDEKAEELVLSCTNKGIDKDLARQVVTRKVGQGLVGMVAKSRKPFGTSDVSNLSPIDSLPTQVTGVNGFAAVPMVTNEKLLGVLVASSPGQWECTPHRMELLSILGNLVATSLENAKLYQESQDQLKRQRIIYKLSSIINSSLHLNEVYDTFADMLTELVKVDRAAVGLIDETQKRVNYVALYPPIDPLRDMRESFPLSESGTYWVVSRRKSLYQADLSTEQQFKIDQTMFERGIRSVLRIPLITKDEAFGCLIISSKQPHAYNQSDREVLEELAGRMGMAISNDLVYEELTKRKNELEGAFSESLRMWVQSWEARYPHTRAHSEKVCQIARRIAMEMGLEEYQVKNIENAARLHDIGIVTVSDEIMLHLDKLSFADKAILEQHPQTGADMLHFSPVFKDITPLIRTHHERYDGKGYPRGLKKDEIPLGGRILGLAEDYVLMSMDLPARKPFTPQDAIKYIRNASGSRYDPRIVEALLKVVTG